MSDPLAVQTENVSKVYRLFPSKGHRLREALNPFRRTYHREFWALKNITLQVPKAHTVGILGMNGSGKSTLLQIIASVLQPTSGTVRVDGKVAALLELGAGFNPELTGRENVMLNGTIMGLGREEILARMAEIEAYADIGEFFDQPMKIYSSGMFMRVAFSTALYVDPEILIIDEALAVGDAKFSEKCFRRFRKFQEAGKTILFVTHDRTAIARYCNMGVLLHQGELVEVGEPGRIADLYGELLTFGRIRPVEALDAAPEGGASPPDPTAVPEGADPAAQQANDAVRAFAGEPSAEDRCRLNPSYNKYEHRTGNGRASIIDYMIVEGDAIHPPSIRSGRQVDVYLKVLFHQAVERPIVGITVKNTEGVLVYAANTEWMGMRLAAAGAGAVRVYRLTFVAHLAPGDWFLELAVAETTTAICDCRSAMAYLYVVDQAHYVGLARLDARFFEVSRAPRVSPLPGVEPA